MTMQEIIGELMKHADEYAIESEEQILIGTEPVRKHRKRRIQKKWIKRFGMKPVYETKKCRKIDVTWDTIIDFCSRFNYPLPDEMLNMINND